MNVLLYASDTASPYRDRAVAFLEGAAAGGEIVYLAWSTAIAYLRIATHPAIFAAPLAPDEAVENLDSLLRLPNVRMLTEDEGFWEVYGEVTRGLGVRGNLVPEAHLAALLRQHGVRQLYTNDADFRRFRFLDVRNPFDPPTA